MTVHRERLGKPGRLLVNSRQSRSDIRLVPAVLHLRVNCVDRLIPVKPVFPDCTRLQMSKKLRGLTLTAILLSASTSAYAENNDYVSNDGFDSSGSSFVGDIASEEAYYGDEYVEPVATTQAADRGYAPEPHYAPAVNPSASRLTAEQLQPAQYQMASFAQRLRSNDCCDSMGCDSGCCDSGCDSGHCGGRKRRGGGLADALNLSGSDGWIRGSALLWFIQDRQAPPLVTTSTGGTFPVLGVNAPDSLNVAYGDELEGGLSGGFRFDVGRYLSDAIGVGGRLWWLSENGSDYTNASTGDPGSVSIGRPFFSVLGGGESALLVAQPNLFAGEVEAREELDMWGAEAYARLRFCGSKTSRLEMIGGFSHFEVNNDLFVGNRTLTLSGPNAGQIREFGDWFEMDNEFNGGQIGFESIIQRGCWTATALTKIHLGNMEMRGNVYGGSTDTNAANSQSGLLVQANTNAGQYTIDEFTFIPEMNFQVGYRFRNHVDFTVGYSFLFFEKLALASGQIDRVVDDSFLGTNGPAPPPGGNPPYGNRPAPKLAVDSLFVHGLDLGVTVTF